MHALAASSFGIGIISWVVLGSVIMNRLFTRPALPDALVPTMAIELGIPAVAGLAYFAVVGRTVNLVACVLGGYAVLMALVQVRLIPIYRRLSFTPGSWSFTFAYAGAAADALIWLAITKRRRHRLCDRGHRTAHRLCLVDRLPHGGPRRPPPAISLAPDLVAAGSQEPDVVLDGLDDLVHPAAQHLLGDAEREALSCRSRDVGRQVSA